MAKLKLSTNVWKPIFVVSPLNNNIIGKSGSLSLNGGTIPPTILHLKGTHMKHFMVRHYQFSFHTPTVVHRFRKLTRFSETEIKFFTFYRTIFTWKETEWNTKSIAIILSTLFNLVIWFLFYCILTSNPSWNSKGIISWLQISMEHISFIRSLGSLLINWNFLLLLMFTQYFMYLVSRKLLAPLLEHKMFNWN